MRERKRLSVVFFFLTCLKEEPGIIFNNEIVSKEETYLQDVDIVGFLFTCIQIVHMFIVSHFVLYISKWFFFPRKLFWNCDVSTLISYITQSLAILVQRLKGWCDTSEFNSITQASVSQNAVLHIKISQPFFLVFFFFIHQVLLKLKDSDYFLYFHLNVHLLDVSCGSRNSA